MIGYTVKNILLKFDKEIEDSMEQPPNAYLHKILVGSCKLLDSKLEKAVNYDITIQVQFATFHFNAIERSKQRLF